MTVVSLNSEESKVQECMVLISFVKYNSLCMPIWTPEAISLLSTANANWTKNYSGVAGYSQHAVPYSYTVLTRLLAESDITTALMINNGSFS